MFLLRVELNVLDLVQQRELRMKKISYAQHDLIRALRILTHKSWAAKNRGDVYGITQSQYDKISNVIDETMAELKGYRTWFKGYVDGELKFEEALTSQIIEVLADEYMYEFHGEYNGEFELRVVEYYPDDDSEVSSYTMKIEHDNTPSITEGRG